MSTLLSRSMVLRRHAANLAIGILVALPPSAGLIGPALAQSGPFCSQFDSGLDSFGPCPTAPNVTVQHVTDANGLDPSNPYMKITDRSGQSAVCSRDPKYAGNWLQKINGCGQLCYDFRVFNSGQPPGPITPSITIRGSGGGVATYVAGFQVAVGDTKWYHICAPIEDGATPPPGTGGGHWVLAGGETWNQIITNVSMVQLPIDFTRNPSEVVGYDNICMTAGECKTPPPPPEIKGCLEGAKVAVECKGGGVYTVTLSGASFAGNSITLTSQTPGVTVSPPQQPWSPTMTFTLTGGSAGQTVTLFANATRNGGGKEPGADQCCSGEIKIVLPKCPEDKPVDISIKKDGATTPAQQPYYSFTMTITNNGAAFTGANNITVTDVLPAGMTFNTVTASPPGDWSCPASVPAGGTLTCTYIGGGPVGSGVIGTLTISATAGGTAPYPPVENCATVAVSGGYTDTNADNNKSCVTVSKKTDTGELIIVKKVVNDGPIPVPNLTYPVTVTCGTWSQSFNLVDNVPQSVGGAPLNTDCNVTETPPPPPAGICPASTTPVWQPPAITPAAPFRLQGATTTVTVTNTFACKPSDQQATGALQVVKTVTNQTEANLTGLTFPATAVCGGASTALNLTAASPQTVSGLAAGTVCSVSETPPPPPTLGCPTGLYPAWEPASVSPSTVTIAAGGTATVTVANTLRCERGGYIAVTKTVVNNTQADVSGLSFPLTMSCANAGAAFQLSTTLTAGGAQLLHNVGIGNTCTPSETLPAAPSGGCPAGQTPTWGAPVYSPATVTSVAGAGPTLTVQNTLNCAPTDTTKHPVRPGVVPPPPGRKIACRPPLVPNAKGDECVCRPGTVLRDGKCVKRVTCVDPAYLNGQGTACLCPQSMMKRGNTCVAREPERRRPGVQPGDVIRVVPGLVPGFGGRGGGDHRGGGGLGGGGRDGGGRSGGGKPAGVN